MSFQYVNVSTQHIFDSWFVAQEKKNKKETTASKAKEGKDDVDATQDRPDEKARQDKGKEPEDKKTAKPKSNWMMQTSPDEADAATSRSKSRSGEFEEVIEESPSSGVTLIV